MAIGSVIGYDIEYLQLPTSLPQIKYEKRLFAAVIYQTHIKKETGPHYFGVPCI